MGWQNRITRSGTAAPADILPNPRNWRRHPQAQRAALAGVLDQVGWVTDVIVNERTGLLVDGHLRVEAALAAGETSIPVKYVDLSPADEALVLATIDPIAAMAEAGREALDALLRDVSSDSPAVQTMLADLAAGERLYEAGTDPTASGGVPAGDRPSLASQFVVPPFSVLDARQGYWQDRKRAWLALGIRSELGRGENAESDGAGRDLGLLSLGGEIERREAIRAAGPARAFAPHQMRGEHVVGGGRRAADQRSNLRGAPMKSEWATATGTENMAPGTSIFDPVLCELAYRWFSPPAGAVLDPFAGGSVRGIVAAKLGRSYTGIDLSAAQVAANAEQWAAMSAEDGDGEQAVPPRWIVGDAADVETLAAGAYDLVFSCPPYADLERYSDDPRDLSTMDYAAFIATYRRIIAACVGLLRDDRFAVFVVGDIRDPGGRYRNFVSDTIAAFQDAGAALYNEAVLVTMLGSLPIRAGRQFAAARKLGKTHQNVLVFIKGDPRRAADDCGAIEVTLPDGMDGAPYGEAL